MTFSTVVRVPRRLSAIAAFLWCFWFGCSQFAADGTECPASTCSDHGVCTYRDTYPTCDCSTGYAGTVCSRCDEGYHRGANDACVADDVCQAGSCAAGQCVVSGGQLTCVCPLGVGGLTCDTCRAGYHRADAGGCALDETCGPSSCAGVGTCSEVEGHVVCSCPADRGGAYCEANMASCASNDPCGVHGACTDADGTVRCLCEPGYGGAACDRCYAGYAESDAGCVLSDQCSPATCSYAGTCSSDAGILTCACAAGTDGERCERCATGFHRGPTGACLADERCESSTCSGHGTCAVMAGAARCSCDTGFAGLHCEGCYPGYVATDAGLGGCALEQRCRADTCRFHGTCDDDGGTVQCACAAGFTGSRCETNVDDCASSACGSGRCIDLISSNVCLCDGGTWGSTCP